MDINYRVPGKISAQFLNSQALVRGIRGPVGSGKSSLCAIALLMWAANQAPNKEGIRKTRFAVVRNTAPELKTTTIKTMQEWMPRAVFGDPKMSPPITWHIKYEDLDCEIIFLGLDSEDDVNKLKSLELTGAWINEAQFIPKIIVDTLLERVGRFPSMRSGGPTRYGIIMDTNSMDPDHWWPIMSGEVDPPDDMPEEDKRMLVKPKEWEFFTQPPAMFEELDDGGIPVNYIVNQKAENIQNITPNYYPNIITGKTRGWILRYVCNQLVTVMEGKRVVPSFNMTTHVSSEPLTISEHATVEIGVDFGLTPAATFSQLINNQRLIQREIVIDDGTAQTLGQRIRQMLATHYAGCQHIITGDPAGTQRSQATGDTPIQILAGMGLSIRPAYTNDFDLRKESVDYAFRQMREGYPYVMVDPSCRTLIKALAGGYHYPEIVSADGTKRHAQSPLKNKYSHVAEALQYLMLGTGEGRSVMNRQRTTSRRTLPTNSGSIYDRQARRRRM